MKKILVYIYLLIAAAGFSQDIPAAYKAYKQKYPEGTALNRWDSVYLMKIPEKTMPVSIVRDELPPVVDNSTLPYLRPVFEQQGPSCGQAAMVGYNFTYEMAYRRDQPAQFPQTQYPTHFTWNFQNGGNGWYGVSYFHSIEILRTCGNMNSADYGDYYDDGKRWINGYDVYYNGMFNRVKGVYSIKTGTEEGILALKHWLHDHMGEGSHGGVASYYANTPWNAHFLNDTTPEGGKHIVTDWYPIASHAMTIIGYNDSIRWDYNNDGLYTNNIDLNNDGIIDPRDWEIGAVKFVNSHGVDAQDEGFCYMMYKCLSETFEQGGVWNREVHILDVDEDYMPLMTYKITLKHNQRKRVKIFAGVSQDTSYTSPEWLIDFPIINYQGDEHYLQGHDTTEALKSLEFGLDITPLLSYLQPGEPAKFFFMVDEDDPFHDGNGEITAFSLMDYTSGQQEIISDETPSILENDSRTIVSLIYYPDFDNVDITTEVLPPFTENEACSLQLEADGGSTPYSWDLMYPYRVEQSSESFPMFEQTQILFSATTDTIMPVALGFDFPFFGEIYDTVYMHINGHLQFDGAQLPWPYMQEQALQLRKNRIIAPAEYFPFTINNSDDDGGWIELNDSTATFRWKLSISSNPGTTEVNFAARIRQNGNIEFIHGTSNYNGVNWISGISAGNNVDYVTSPVSGLNSVVAGTKVGFESHPLPSQAALSETGLFTALSANEEQIYDITFRVTDDHGLSSSKVLQFTSGPYLFFSINAGDDDRVNFGDTVSMNLEIKNGGQETLENTTITISSDDPFIDLLDASCTPGTLLPGQLLTIPGAFLFAVAVDVPDQHDLLMNADLIADYEAWHKELQFKAHAPILQVKQFAIETQDGILDPGETAPLMIILQNTGNAAISGVIATLYPLDPEIQVIEEPVQDYGTIGRGMSVSRSYSLHADESVPHGFITHLLLSSVSSEGLQRVDTISFRIGKTPVMVIDMDPANHSGPGIYAMLDELDVLANYEYNITQQIFNYQSLFICLGYQNFNHVLTLWEGQKLVEFLEAGGKIYMEGRKTWWEDPPTPIQPLFNINTVQTVGVYDTINGMDGTFTQGLSMSNDATTPFSFYSMEPIEPAFSVLADNNTGQVCAVAYDAGTYKTIGALFEYGTMSDISTDAMLKLMIEYLEFFGMEVEPVGVEEHGGPGEKETGGQGEEGKILRIWPNPTSSLITISPSPGWGRVGVGADGSQRSAVGIEIFDLFGRNLLQFDNITSFPFQIDISGLEDGMYILNMTDDEGLSSSSKFLKIAD
jgi:hypothetical protein